tara:strand:+ start:204 stop:521 length:318 start_codon:yes stop_codon:yes gene_type:complete
MESESSFFKPIQMDLSFAKNNIYKMSKLSGRKLSALIQGFPVRGIEGALSQGISSIAFDSREVEDGGLFVAIRGFKQDGLSLSMMPSLAERQRLLQKHLLKNCRV